jgi:predicted ArsR family transcriptional regulator
MNPTRVRVLAAIAAESGLTADGVSDRLGLADGVTPWHLDQLAESKLIDWHDWDEGESTVSITPFGRHCLYFAQQVIR